MLNMLGSRYDLPFNIQGSILHIHEVLISSDMKSRDACGEIHSNHLRLQGSCTLSTFWYYIECNVLETGLFSSSGERVGGRYLLCYVH